MATSTEPRVTLTLITTVLDLLAVLLFAAALVVLLVTLPVVGWLLAAGICVLGVSWAITRSEGER